MLRSSAAGLFNNGVKSCFLQCLHQVLVFASLKLELHMMPPQGKYILKRNKSRPSKLFEMFPFTSNYRRCVFLHKTTGMHVGRPEVNKKTIHG